MPPSKNRGRGVNAPDSTPARATRSSPRDRKDAKAATKTSPYFSKTKGKTSKSKSESEDEEDDPEPSGLTSDSESSSDNDASEEAFEPSSGDEGADDDQSVVESETVSEVDSDNLDATPKTKRRKLNSSSVTPKKTVKAKPGETRKLNLLGSQWARDGHKPRPTATHEGEEDEEDEEEVELEEGQFIAGRIYPAPKTGRVPPGRISKNTLEFLGALQFPENNDREWFKSHEPAYRVAEQEWKDFVSNMQVLLSEADPEIPVLPPRDVIHRIYRDTRFSTDKSPYKTNLSFSTSRTGRKGPWAGYHICICPRGHSFVACGQWQPEKEKLATLRENILADPESLRAEIGKPEFVKLFGPAKPHKDRRRQNVFGHSDELKVAPKGIDKTHKDIDLLKLRTMAVVYKFTDADVLKEDFAERIKGIAVVMAPFVHKINEYLVTNVSDDDVDDEGEDVEDEPDED